jgi:hypothetical protein
VAPSVTRRRPAAVFFAALLSIVLYLVLFPYPLGREIVVRPAWAVTVPPPSDPAASAAPAGDGPLAPFQLGAAFGYVDPSGRFAHVEQVLSQVALSVTGFVNFTRLGTTWILQDPGARRVLSFSGSGYPLLSPDRGRVFVVAAALGGLAEMDDGGEPRWSRDFSALLTSVSVRGDLLAAGLLDGRVQLLGTDGALLLDAAPGKSRIPVVLAVALAGNGSRAAALSGIDPQVLTIYARRGAGFAEESRQQLASDFRREVRMEFSNDGRLVLFESPSAGSLYDPSGRRLALQPLPGPVAGFAFPGQGRMAAFVGRTDAARAELVVDLPFVGAVFTAALAVPDGSAVTVSTVGGELLLGIGARLMRLDVVRR